MLNVLWSETTSSEAAAITRDALTSKAVAVARMFDKFSSMIQVLSSLFPFEESCLRRGDDGRGNGEGAERGKPFTCRFERS